MTGAPSRSLCGYQAESMPDHCARRLLSRPSVCVTQFHFTPETYLAEVRREVPAYDQLQDEVATAARRLRRRDSARDGERFRRGPTEALALRSSVLYGEIVDARLGVAAVRGGWRSFGVAITLLVVLHASPALARTSRSATFRLRVVLAEIPADKPAMSGHDPAVAATIKSCDRGAVLALPAIPTTTSSDDTDGSCVVIPGPKTQGKVLRYLLAPVSPSAPGGMPAGLTGRDVARAQGVFASVSGFGLEITLTSDGLNKENALANYLFEQNPSPQVALVLNGQAITVTDLPPLASSPKLLVVDQWNRSQARRLADLLNKARRVHYL